MTFITIMVLLIVMALGFALGGGVSGTDKTEYKSVTVESGDTLWNIAETNKPADKSIRQYVADIRAINDVDPGKLYPGQTIEIPVY
jgi:LysM repeat protein